MWSAIAASPSRPLLPFGNFDQPGRGGGSATAEPPAEPDQVPLAAPGRSRWTHAGADPAAHACARPDSARQQEGSSGEIAVERRAGEVPGEIPAVKRRPTPGPLTAWRSNRRCRCKVDTDGTPSSSPGAPAGRARDRRAPAVPGTPAHRRRRPARAAAGAPAGRTRSRARAAARAYGRRTAPGAGARTGAGAGGRGAAAAAEDAVPRVDHARAHRAQGQDADPGARDAGRRIRRGRSGFLRARSGSLQARGGRNIRRPRFVRRRRAVQVAPQAQERPGARSAPPRTYTRVAPWPPVRQPPPQAR